MELYPIVTDLAALESWLYALLTGTADNETDLHFDNDLVKEEVNEAQAAIILAWLSLGFQFAENDAATRQEVSQDLVNRSNKCLQEANYTLNPSVEVVQALLLIGLAQQNLEQSDAAWALLGLTHRIAQTLGLDRPQTSSGNDSKGSQSHPLWQSILWQDALLCLRYDRKLLAYNTGASVPGEADSSRHELSYGDAMNRICSITRELI